MAGHNRERRSAVMLTMIARDLTVSAELLLQVAVGSTSLLNFEKYS